MTVAVLSRSVIPAILFTATLVGACSAEERTAHSPPALEMPVELDARTRPTMTRRRIAISSDLGRITAELDDNAASKALVGMLPLTIQMRDHLRQEKTGSLPSPLPEQQRQTEFSAGTLGLWGSDDFVLYYRDGRVPRPGIVVLGRVTGDVSIFDRPGPVTVRVQLAD